MTKVGTIETSAPEVLQFGMYSVYSDVYSFGIMLYELVFEQPLYDDLEAYEVMQKIVKDELRPTIPTTLPEGYPPAHVDRLVRVMKACWYADPKKRPHFDAIAHELGSVLSELRPEPDTPFYSIYPRDNMLSLVPKVVHSFDFSENSDPVVKDEESNLLDIAPVTTQDPLRGTYPQQGRGDHEQV